MSGVRINLVSGFLGSGKTTFVRRVLGERSVASVGLRRTAVR